MRRFFDKPSLSTYFGNVVKTVTFRQSAVTFSGTLINGLLGAGFYIVAARLLGPSLFGVLSIAIVTLALVADIGDFGTNTGLTRFVSKYAKDDPQKANQFLKLGLIIKLTVAFLVIIIGVLLSPFIANTLLTKPELVIPLRISFIGVGTTWLFSFITVTLQSFQKFWKWSIIQIITNFLRFLLVVIFFLITKIDVNSTLIVYILMPFIGFVIGLTMIPRGFIKSKNEFSLFKEFFQYNKWVAVFLVIASISSRLDTFISARLLTVAEIGFYGAATQLTQVIPQLVGAIGTVIAPKMAGMGNLKTVLAYYKKTQIFVLGLAILGLAVIPFARFIIPFLYGKEFVGAVPVFIILICAMLVFLISVPIHNMVIYYFAYPKLFSLISLVHLLIIAIFGWFMISRFGLVGAAFSVLVAQIMDFIIPAIWLYQKIKNPQYLVTER